MEWAVLGLVAVLLGFGVYLANTKSTAERYFMQAEFLTRDLESAKKLIDAYAESDKVDRSLSSARRLVRQRLLQSATSDAATDRSGTS